MYLRGSLPIRVLAATLSGTAAARAASARQDVTGAWVPKLGDLAALRYDDDDSVKSGRGDASSDWHRNDLQVAENNKK